MDPLDIKSTDPFIDLPDEILIDICHRLNTKDLLRLTESSSKIYQTCSEIIDIRKEEYYLKLFNMIEKGRNFSLQHAEFYNPISKDTIILKIINPNIKYRELKMDIYADNWIFPFLTPRNNHIEIQNLSFDLFLKIMTSLEEKGYRRRKSRYLVD